MTDTMTRLVIEDVKIMADSDVSLTMNRCSSVTRCTWLQDSDQTVTMLPQWASIIHNTAVHRGTLAALADPVSRHSC